MTPAGFPHSGIHGSLLAFSFPWLFVDRYALLRLPVPRHPPCALSSLTSFKQSIEFVRIFRVLSNSYLFWLNYSFLPLYLFPLLHHFTCNLISLFSFQGTRGLFTRPVVGSSGLEPPTSRLSGVRSNHLSYEPMFLLLSKLGGDEQNRTVDPLLARQVLSQLSYTPMCSRVSFHPLRDRSLKIKQYSHLTRPFRSDLGCW